LIDLIIYYSIKSFLCSAEEEQLEEE